MKTFKLYTLGCKVNQYESQAIRESLVSCGFIEAAKKKPADIYIVNSCTVTSRADNKSLEMLRLARQENPRAKIVLTGCVVDGSDRSQLKKTPADLLIGNQLKHRLAQMIKSSRAKPKKISGFLPLRISGFKAHSRAFVKIQDGCDNVCAYCKIPLVRGKSRSRPLAQIIEEVRILIGKGFKEIVLTGICLGAYGRDIALPDNGTLDLAEVISELEKIPSDFRLRLSSIEAKDLTDRLIAKIARSAKMCRHLHIPFQSGDDEILRKMRRHYRQRDYLRVAQKLRRAMPGIAITTDIMVGFPSEKSDNFAHTLQLVQKVSPTRVHIFPFSPRQGTRAEIMSGRVLQATVRGRENILRDLAAKKAREYQERFIGRTLTVLVEHRRDKKSGLLKGYTENYIPVLLKGGDGLMGELVKIKIANIDESAVVARRI
jgi:threonylcarbamoyladenosine tRNA methylthiotransferase MtaB